MITKNDEITTFIPPATKWQILGHVDRRFCRDRTPFSAFGGYFVQVSGILLLMYKNKLHQKYMLNN